MKQNNYKAGQLVGVKGVGIFRITIHNGTMACMDCMFDVMREGRVLACEKYCMFGYAKIQIPQNCYLKLVKKF